jgi:hypothetical protein
VVIGSGYRLELSDEVDDLLGVQFWGPLDLDGYSNDLLDEFSHLLLVTDGSGPCLVGCRVGTDTRQFPELQSGH